MKGPDFHYLAAYALEDFISVPSWLLSPSPENKTDRASNDEKILRRKMPQSREWSMAKESVRTAQHGSSSGETTMKRGGSWKRAIPVQTFRGSAGPATSPLNRSPLGRSSSAIHTPLCAYCGRVGLYRKEDRLFCPICNDYQ